MRIHDHICVSDAENGPVLGFTIYPDFCSGNFRSTAFDSFLDISRWDKTLIFKERNKFCANLICIPLLVDRKTCLRGNFPQSSFRI